MSDPHAAPVLHDPRGAIAEAYEAGRRDGRESMRATVSRLHEALAEARETFAAQHTTADLPMGLGWIRRELEMYDAALAETAKECE